MKIIKKLILIGIVLGLIGGGYGYYLYNKAPDSISKSKTELSLNASQLISDFKNNESQANATYMNKVVEVSGVVSEITNEGGVTNIILDTKDPISSVICEMAQPHKNVSIGKPITIKGKCVGYLMDVVINKAIVL